MTSKKKGTFTRSVRVMGWEPSPGEPVVLRVQFHEIITQGSKETISTGHRDYPDAKAAKAEIKDLLEYSKTFLKYNAYRMKKLKADLLRLIDCVQGDIDAQEAGRKGVEPTGG